MPRPKHPQPTPNELAVLQLLWEHGPATVREICERLPHEPPRAYTSVMSLLNVMFEKGLVNREPQGRAFLYQARATRRKTLGAMVQDLLGRAFAGSTHALVAHLLDQEQPNSEELAEIRRLIADYERTHTDSPSAD